VSEIGMRPEGRLVVLLLLLCSAGSAQDFEIAVPEPSMEAVQAAIDSCPRGYGERQQSCQIRLPSGTIRGHWRIGGSQTTSTQVAVCLIGQGPGFASIAPDGRIGAGGTTLAYEGPAGGIMLNVIGGDFLCLRDLTLAMEGAGVGVRISANYRGAASSQYPFLERVAIRGNRSRPAGTGLLITGATRNDQVDALLAQSLQIADVDVGIECDSNQAALNRIGPGSKISARSAAVRIRRGSLSLDGVLAQCRAERCCTYDLLHEHGYFRVRDGFHEIGAPPARNARLFCLSSDAPSVGSWAMVSMDDSYVNVLCDSTRAPCAVDLIRGRSNTTVSFRDNWIVSTNSSANRTFARVVFSGLYGAPRLVWSGNAGIPIRALLGAGTRVEAITSDGTRTWNDTNLDGDRDAFEPVMPAPP
jgi:hypothetical protein